MCLPLNVNSILKKLCQFPTSLKFIEKISASAFLSFLFLIPAVKGTELKMKKILSEAGSQASKGSFHFFIPVLPSKRVKILDLYLSCVLSKT